MITSNRAYLSLVLLLLIGNHCILGQTCPNNSIPDFFYNVDFAGPNFDQVVYTLPSRLNVSTPCNTSVFNFTVTPHTICNRPSYNLKNAQGCELTAAQLNLTVRSSDPSFAVLRNENNVYTLRTNACPLRYYSPFNRYLFELIAKQPVPSQPWIPPVTSRAIVQIDLENDNVHAPIFVPENQTFYVSDTIKPETPFGTVYASDADNDGIKYSIDGTQFNIDSATGVLRLLKPFEPSIAKYSVHVTATDDGSSCSGRPNCTRSSSTIISIIVLVVNKKPPVFLGEICGRNISFKEEQDANTIVKILSVFSDDRDGNGPVNITFLPQQMMTAAVYDQNDPYSLFRIEQSNQLNSTRRATIRANQKLDYDIPGTKRFWYLYILATDNGKPQRQTVCHLRINLVDINDNAPNFTMSTWNYTIYKSTINTVANGLLRITALDPDSGLNGMIKYYIGTINVPYFSINHTTGMIMLRSGVSEILNLNASFSVNFQVYAVDRGSPSQMSRTNATVIINYNNDDSFPPGRWADPRYQELNITISEKFYEENSSQYISDPNFNGSIFYILTPPSSSQMSVASLSDTANQPFAAVSFPEVGSIRQSGIRVTKSLDAATRNVYLLQTLVPTQPPLTGLVTVNLGDENDNYPMFDINSISLSIVENEGGNRTLIQIQAYDRDVDYKNNRILYKLNTDRSDNETIDKFHVTSDGIVWTNATFGGANNRTLYELYIRAYNEQPMWSSALSNGSDFQLDVKVLKNNANPPRLINGSSMPTLVDETTTNGTVILNVTIIDPDINTTLNLGISKGNVRSAFTFTFLSDNSANESRTQYEAIGQVKVVAPLDYRLTSTYSLCLFASDTKNIGTVNITVPVQRNAPVPYVKRMPGFNAFIYETMEGLEVSELNGPYIRAKDPDNASVSFEYTILDKYSNYRLNLDNIVLNPRDNFATIGIKAPGLSRDLPYGSPVYNFAINVSKKNSIGLSSYAPVTIRVIDINNNAPIPTNSPWTIEENVSNPSLNVIFEDFDDPAQNNTLPFTVDIIRPSNFDILPTFSFTGNYTLSFNGMLNRATTKNLTVTFNASDVRGRSETTTISIIVRDTPNSCPISPASKTIRVIYVNGYENSVRNVALGSIYVVDCNDWYPMNRNYMIQESPEGFSASRDGWLSTSQRLNPGSYKILVNVVKSLNGISAALSNINLQVESVDSEYVRQAATIRIRGEYPETLIDLPLGNPLSRLLNALASLLSVRAYTIKILTIRSVFQYRNPYDRPKTLEAEKNDALTDVVFYIPGRARSQIECTLRDKLVQFETQFSIKANATGSNPCCDYRCPRGTTGQATRTILPKPNLVDTNQTSFVGLNILDSCDCVNLTYMYPVDSSNECNVSCNQPTVSGENGPVGPNGEVLGRVFDGVGAAYAIFDPRNFSNYAPARFSLDFIGSSSVPEGLVLLYGRNTPPENDFFWMAAEIVQSKLIFHFRNNSYAANESSITSSTWYHVEWQFIDSLILVSINDCQYLWQVDDSLSTDNPSTVELYLGGIPTENAVIANLYPNLKAVNKFKGCIRNVLSNGRYLDMSKSRSSVASYPGECPCSVTATCPQSYSNVIIPWYTWLVIALVFLLLATICAMVLLTLARRGRQLKALTGLYVDDTRETIIDYKETAGEEDHSTYNLRVLKKPIYARSDSNTTPNNDRLDYENPRFLHRPSLDNYIQRKLSEQVISYAHDTQLRYRDEGEGSKASDISSISSLAVHVERDQQYLRSLGPKFSNLAYLYSDDDET